MTPETRKCVKKELLFRRMNGFWEAESVYDNDVEEVNDRTLIDMEIALHEWGHCVVYAYRKGRNFPKKVESASLSSMISKLPWAEADDQEAEVLAFTYLGLKLLGWRPKLHDLVAYAVHSAQTYDYTTMKHRARFWLKKYEHRDFENKLAQGLLKEKDYERFRMERRS